MTFFLSIWVIFIKLFKHRCQPFNNHLGSKVNVTTGSKVKTRRINIGAWCIDIDAWRVGHWCLTQTLALDATSWAIVVYCSSLSLVQFSVTYNRNKKLYKDYCILCMSW
jgi:hypothetical protein